MSRRRLNSYGVVRSDNVTHVTEMLMWELSWVRKMGLEDIDWDPERYCECCRARRAKRGEAVEDLAPPSGTRFKFLLRDNGEHATTPASASRKRGRRRDHPAHVKLVRPPRPEPKS